MKRFLICFFAAVFVTISFFAHIPLTVNGATKTYSDGFVPATDSNIKYLGRWAKQDGGAYEGYFESGLEFAFTGKSLSIALDGISGILYSVDGNPYTDITAPKGTLSVANGTLSNGEHILKLYSRFDVARPKISGFVIDKGAKSLPVKDKPVIEFIGDSISVGWIGRDFTQYNNLSSAFGFKTGEALGYSHNTVAFGGITVVPGAGSPDTSGMISRYYKLKEYREGETNVPNWDTSKYVPDYLVINLGTNDVVTDNDFKKGYVNFLEKLRQSYPKSLIFAMSPFGNKYKDAINLAVHQRKNAGDNSVIFIDTSGWISWRDTTDGVHLTVEAQEVAAQKLTNALKMYISIQASTTAAKSNATKATPTTLNTAPGVTSTSSSSTATDTSTQTTQSVGQTAETTNIKTVSSTVTTTSGSIAPSDNKDSDFNWSALHTVFLILAIMLIGMIVFVVLNRKKLIAIFKD